MSLHIPLVNENFTTIRTFKIVSFFSMLFQFMPLQILVVSKFGIAQITLEKNIWRLDMLRLHVALQISFANKIGFASFTFK